MAQVGLITIHGMGDTKEDYADALLAKLRRRVGDGKWSNVVHSSIYYQNILQNNQRALFDRVKDDLRYDDLRKFILFGISDAATLETQKFGPDNPYLVSQQRILNAFMDVLSNLTDKTAPVVVVAQSLGCQVISNYFWDATPLSERPVDDAGNPRAPSVGVWANPPAFDSEATEAFCRARTVKRFFTTGCNIPIFQAGRDSAKIDAIKPLSSGFQWHNYYDADDVLGWPLQPLSESYDNLVKDHKINAGLLGSFTPFSHLAYWEDRDVVNPIAAALENLVDR